MFEHFTEVLVAEDDVGSDIVDGVGVDVLEDGGVRDGEDVLLFDFLHGFV